jgi:hypothetical protein
VSNSLAMKPGSLRKTPWLFAALTLVSALAFNGGASAYFGESFLQVPGINGGAKEIAFKGWIRAEGNYWGQRGGREPIRQVENALLFTMTTAPRNGPDMLSIAVDKKGPGMQPLMDMCHAGGVIPEVKYVESAELARARQERGMRPAGIPEYYQFSLKNVQLTCPVVDGAPEQAFSLKFESIQWLNATPQSKPLDAVPFPNKMLPAPKTGKTKTFVVTSSTSVSEGGPEQCPAMNTKPTEADYYALMSKERAAEQRKAAEKSGGVNTFMYAFRGPDEMNVCLLPGVVRDPGHIAPPGNIVEGIDLDGDNGAAPSANKYKRNLTAPDGRKGIDNQLYNVIGCVDGFRSNGFLALISNQIRREGALAVLIEVSGIDNELNDDDVAVTLLYSNDVMKRDGTSTYVLPDYTYRVTDRPYYRQSFARFRGKLVNGVVTTDPLDLVVLHSGSSSTAEMENARMRLEFKPDGTIHAVLAGYRDWRQYIAGALAQQSAYENTMNMTCPGVYNAVRRAVDGLPDPVTGELRGISTATEMEGIPAYIPEAQHKRLMAKNDLTH